MLFHTLLHPPFPWERGKGGWSSVWRRKKICSLKNLNQKFEKGACEGGKGACAGGLLGAATDLAPEDLMAGAAEIQGALCWHQTEGRCWRWGQIRMCHVKTQKNIETEGTGTADTSEARYFAKDTDVGEHHLLYAPIFLCTHRVFLLFLTTYHFCNGVALIESWLCITQHTQLARPSSFRETHTGALNCEIPKWTSKKFELATKVLCFHDTVMHSFFSHDPRFISFHTILDSAYSHTFFLFTRS